MNPKTRNAVLAAAGIALLVYGLSRISGQGIPGPFLQMKERLAASSSVEVELLWPQPGSYRHSRVMVRWSRKGNMVVDVLEGPQGRLSLFDGKVRLATADIKLPIPSLNASAKELVGELLSGFANSEWRQIDPPKHGILPSRQDRLWASITLPFDWARNHELQMGVSKETGALEAIVVVAKTESRVAVTLRQLGGGQRTLVASESPQLWLVIEGMRRNYGASPDDFDPQQHP